MEPAWIDAQFTGLATTTLEYQHGPVDDPVQALGILKSQTLYRLDDFRCEDQPKRLITIGSAPFRDIVPEDSTFAPSGVSRLHCLLVRENDRVFVWDHKSKNGTRINGVRIGEVAELRSGNVLTIGRVTFLACGQAGLDQAIDITAPNLDVYFRTAIDTYGTQEKAANALGLWQGTLSRWLKGRRFAQQAQPTKAQTKGRKRP